MLFNSLIFVGLFLPVVVAAFYLSLARIGLVAAQIVLLIASLVFYAADEPARLLLLALSICVNYAFSLALTQENRRLLLGIGVAFNLAMLVFFKYLDLLAETLGTVSGLAIPPPNIGLPLGISFLIFHQISYLVDVQRKLTRPASFWRYALYISFFSHLIAGPIVRHAELMPQLQRPPSPSWREHLAVGFTIFVFGLAKKLLLADPLSAYADPIFDASGGDIPISAMTAWLAAIAYSFQIYFDFSAYSDMAIGLARIFGLRLPVNFLAPYRALSIIQFWRRWHVTLSKFLRDYLYFPLGGNRLGVTRAGST